MGVVREKQIKIARRHQDTYVYIDVSNIRSACLKTLGFMVDFVKLLNYFKKKYPNFKEARYYEGIAIDDTKKHKMFSFLRSKGYVVCPLERKSYNSVEIEKQDVKCLKCGNEWTAEFTKEHKTMKSNVDVYLASDMVAQASITDRPIRLILVSCDGDYAEAIKTAFKLNTNVSVGVLATPPVKNRAKNTLSVRLKALLNELPKERYSLNYISFIKDKVASDK